MFQESSEETEWNGNRERRSPLSSTWGGEARGFSSGREVVRGANEKIGIYKMASAALIGTTGLPRRQM